MVKAAWEPQNALCGNLTMFRDDLSGIGDLNTYPSPCGSKNGSACSAPRAR
jgi:hypothetical protein